MAQARDERSNEGSGLAALGRVVAASRFELVPLRGALEAARASVPRGSVLTVTCSPTKGLEPTIALCEALARSGFDAMPHLAARAVRDREHLEAVLARLEAAGVRRAFVVGGDGAPRGSFADGLSLLRAIDELGYRFAEVGVPAYPEGHVAIADDVLSEALLAKQPYVDHVATQLCFDASAIERWVTGARAAGLTVPVMVGIPGPTDVARLLRIAARIGVAGAASYLRKNRGLLSAVLRRRAFDPDRLLSGLHDVVSDPTAGVRGLHVFTFNHLDAAVAWRDRWTARP